MYLIYQGWKKTGSSRTRIKLNISVYRVVQLFLQHLCSRQLIHQQCQRYPGSQRFDMIDFTQVTGKGNSNVLPSVTGKEPGHMYGRDGDRIYSILPEPLADFARLVSLHVRLEFQVVFRCLLSHAPDVIATDLLV